MNCGRIPQEVRLLVSRMVDKAFLPPLSGGVIRALTGSAEWGAGV